MDAKDSLDKEELENTISRLRKRIQSLEEEQAKKESQESVGKFHQGDPRISRRSFLKLVGLGAGGLALSSSGLGASLLNGTTIGDEIAWHAGNDGPGSGLNADMTDGNHVSVGSTKPGSPASDTLFFDTGNEGVQFYNGSEWIPIIEPPSMLYGPGTDGSITRASNGTENGILFTTDYTLQEGVTRTASGTVIIHATGKITINGTLEAVNEGTGGSGGGDSADGEVGADGLYISNGGSGGASSTGSSDGEDGGQYGGGGGSLGALGSTFGSGGDAGSGGSGSLPSDTSDISENLPLMWQSGDWGDLFSLASSPAAGGGGGGGASGVAGGDGGNGGGLIILLAPEIEIGQNGTVSAAGQDGGDGVPGGADTTASGGGGGGAGGLVYVFSSDLTETGSISAAGGAGGIGGSGSSYNGGDGADGADGQVHRISVT